MSIAIPFAAVEEGMLVQAQRALFNAVATVILPAEAAGQQLGGTFDEAYLLIDLGSGVESSSPAIAVADADMPSFMADALEEGDPVALEIRGRRYTVVEPKPDGVGITVLRLRKA